MIWLKEVIWYFPDDFKICFELRHSAASIESGVNETNFSCRTDIPPHEKKESSDLRFVFCVWSYFYLFFINSLTKHGANMKRYTKMYYNVLQN